MRRDRTLGVFALAIGMVLLASGHAQAAEVDPPMGTKMEFSTDSPGVTSSAVQPTGTYVVPEGWSSHSIELKVYTVKKDGGKGDHVAGAAGKKENGFWNGTVTGLSPDTEYFLEARLKLTKDGLLTNDYAYNSTDSLLKFKTKAKKGIFDEDEDGGGAPPSPP